MSQTHELTFGGEICAYLGAHGWLVSQNDAGYDRELALFPEDVFAWLEATQPEQLAKKVKPSMSEGEQAKARTKLLRALADDLNAPDPQGGSLQVLRRGFKNTPATFTMMEKRPEKTSNAKVNARYAANRLRVMREVRYSTKNENRIDLVLFVNGIPVATVELKTDFNQSVEHAKRQYRDDRPPAGEPLLTFGARALVHFAVSNDEVWMTTRLAGKHTRFLPFNRGDAGHAGNGPDEDGGCPTTYLWRDVWARDQWLDILGKFIHYETDKSTDPKTGKQSVSKALIFPRYHQLDAVTKIVADARELGAGQKYLIQHSAGSGKTRSIAWTAHRLATLHDANDAKVFDTVIVVTDRTVLDDQLQEAVRQIEPAAGMVATINQNEAAKALTDSDSTSKSSYLTKTLASGKLIIVVTIQTFPFVLDKIASEQSLKGRRFAVIADEAHSSQTGQTAAKLKEVLSPQEIADMQDGGEVSVNDLLEAKMAARGDTDNVSFVAFTATPKQRTLELFGRPDPTTDLPRPFHLYTMAQAIEEEFILDVLASYTTYDTAFQLATKSGNATPDSALDGEGMLVDEQVATKGLMHWVKLHPTNIAQKVQIIIEHFDANVKDLLDGRAKAMVVTDSRKAAVRYKHAMDRYLAEHKIEAYTSLVAFSGEVEDPQTPQNARELLKGNTKHSEATMNPKGTKDLRTAFTDDAYRVMIVANKFQTGFDQPLLCAMYVDRKLSGVTAVQTLSRLNRFKPGKRTMVLDFVNSADDILAAFKPYYEEAEIVETTDPDSIHRLQRKLDAAGLYDDAEVDDVVEKFVRGAGNTELSGALTPIKRRFVERRKAARASKDAVELEALAMFRKDLRSFVKLYDFLSQVLNFDDTDVEKRSIFYRLLSPHLRDDDETPTVDLSDVSLRHIATTKQADTKLDLAAGEKIKLKPAGSAGTGQQRDPKMVLLDELVERLNERFAGEGFKDDQIKAWAGGILAEMEADDDLRDQAQANSEDQFLESTTLRDALVLAVSDSHDAQERMGELLSTDDAVETTLLNIIGRLLYRELKANL
ncbi:MULTISPECIES: type I restriction endonuclease subunit R [Dermacoccus]|uniref:Type I restriction endonuclease subunit R n=2 Tax=Dermacoccus TaxID=57495 RepID=A0A417Z1Y0_9MICO|nr:type I restriction endonuclease [Dermacoccus abyssi]RHW44205.1 type I restriction endonuclease subunit R [Dermacoccus abyssi]